MERIGPNQLRKFVKEEGEKRHLNLTVERDLNGFPPEIHLDGKCLFRPADIGGNMTHTCLKRALICWLMGYDCLMQRIVGEGPRKASSYLMDALVHGDPDSPIADELRELMTKARGL